jgi:hypothetical protein
MQLARHPVEGDGFEIGVAGDHQVPEHALAEADAALGRIGPGEQRHQGVVARVAPGLDQREGDGRRGLRDEAHGAVDDGVALVALAGERAVIARRPDRPAGHVEGDGGRGARGLGLAPHQPSESVKHFALSFPRTGSSDSKGSRGCDRD